jgi:16S rRNA (cytosine967-C5)-methyltransferase
LRVRTGYQEEIRVAFESRGIPWRPHPVLPNACQAPERFALCQWPTFSGKVEIQDVSSQVVGWLAQPTSGSNWWDACAGAGGKTLHLADRLQGTGRILATDIRASARREAQRRFAAAGLRNVAAAAWDGHRDPAPGREFDGVLLDVPCSGLGTWHRNPDARWRIVPATIPTLVREQQLLLAQGAAKVKPGGVLLYVTCTLTAAEDTGVVAAFCQSHPGFRLAPLVNPLNGQRTDGMLWLWPWTGPGNGMFIARFTRVAS